MIIVNDHNGNDDYDTTCVFIVNISIYVYLRLLIYVNE